MSEQHVTAEEDRIPLFQKFAYGLGMLGNQLFPAALGVFLVVLVERLGMSPFLVGILAFLPRLVDALTDPIMGFISDNTKSRWGRRRPYIFIGAIIAGLSYIAMWQLNPENSHLFNFIYFLFFSVVFYLGLTIFATPYVAMGYEMTKDFHERTRLMAVSQWVGQWAWVIAPWFWVVIYDTRFFPDGASGARTLAIWVGLGCLVLAMMPAILCKTQQVDESKLQDLSRKNLKNNLKVFVDGFKLTFKCRPFQRLCAATFFVFNAFQTVAAFSFYIIVFYMYNGDASDKGAGTWPAWFFSVGALCTCFIVIPLITIMANKFGKKTAFIIAQFISVLGYLLFWWCFEPGNPALMFLPLPLFAFGIGGLFTLMMSMTADVCDLDELNTGARREGAFGAVYWWMVKFGFAAAGLGAGALMSFVGFQAGSAEQTEEAMMGLRLAYTAIPVIGTLIAIWIMWGYDITEEKAYEIRAKLDARARAIKADGEMA